MNSTQLVARCREKLQWSKSTTYTVLRRLCHKGAAANEEATVTPLVTREEVLKAQGRSSPARPGASPPSSPPFSAAGGSPRRRRRS